MAYKLVNADEVEAQRGIFKALTRLLGVEAFGINMVELAPGAAGLEHDHAGDRQEEVYVPLRGRGSLRVDGEVLDLEPGVIAFVSPESTRQLVASSEQGFTFVAVGGARP
ncbi:MAG: cupin domain-containing protein [Thermoleophilia bacterium]|nr:cupin domain-containing protein [Thermoleophilia bacterium]